MSLSNPLVTVIICTRNRGDSVVATLESVFANTFEDYEVIVVDQSTNVETRIAVERFRSEPRFVYLPSDTKGAGRARNRAFSISRGEFLLITDDDCIVPQDWMEEIVALFQKYPQVGVIFSNVLEGEHDKKSGVIPHYEYTRSKVVRTVLGYAGSIGMGAGMSVRRVTMEALDSFDESLGPGSRFFSGEDHDFALRALLNGWWVYEATEVGVVHNGFRTFKEFRSLTQRDWIALGAVHAKFIKSARWRILILVVYNLWVRCIWQPLSLIFEGKLPQGFRRFIYYWQGFFKGLFAAVDRQKILYLPDEP